MPKHTASEKEKNRQGKSAAAIAALETTEQSKPKPKPKPKPKAKEKVGTGRDDSESNFDRISRKLRGDIATATAAGNTAHAATLKARLARVREATDQAK